MHRSPHLHCWEIVPVGGLHQDELAEVFGTAQIFISLSHREGLGLPPAEAMASGCYVIGFTGDGGREFMLSEVCSPVEYPNLITLVREVEKAATLWDTDRPTMERTTALARDFALTHFSDEHFRVSVVSTFEELTLSGSPAHQESEILLSHYSAIKPPSTFDELASLVSPWVPAAMRSYWRNRNN